MKVLLVDADLRRARLHRRLGVDNSRGLSELFGEAPPPLDDLLQWINPLTASSGWTLIGNSATTSGGVLGAVPTAGTNFLGTID